jgi:hypothetical protein
MRRCRRWVEAEERFWRVVVMNHHSQPPLSRALPLLSRSCLLLPLPLPLLLLLLMEINIDYYMYKAASALSGPRTSLADRLGVRR